jgi:Protein of unknown function (DUF2281)
MSTTAEKLREITCTLPEPLLAEVLDFAEFLRAKRAPIEHAPPLLRLFDLYGGLEDSLTFGAEPMAIQRKMRDAWH